MTDIKSREAKLLDGDALLAELAAWWATPEAGKYSGTVPGRIAGGKWDQEIPEGAQNPYWEIIRQLPLDDMGSAWGRHRPEPTTHVFTNSERGVRYFADRFDLCATYSWAMCSPGDIAWLKDVLAGRAVVETGAGTGYWAWQMEQAGIDAVAYEPNEQEEGNTFARRTWTTVLRDDHGASRHHPDRALFLAGRPTPTRGPRNRWPPTAGTCSSTQARGMAAAAPMTSSSACSKRSGTRSARHRSTSRTGASTAT